MAYKPTPGDKITIDNVTYQVAEHPQAPGMPYGQEGRRAVVYQLISGKGIYSALKVFKARFRVPGMVSVAETLEPYAALGGLQACTRTVLTGSRHPDLLRDYPDLTYAVLMPWVEGSTWQEILLDSEDFPPERSLGIARTFSKLLMALEEKRLAHCDLSGANLILQKGDKPALVDLEEMYGPGFLEPESLPAGSQGYAHKTGPIGLWSPTADRFAGAILLTEMLCWHDLIVRDVAWGESYFAPKDMQTENKRLDVLRNSLETHYGKRILDLFDQAWCSEILRDCPTFAEWSVALPACVKTQESVDSTQAAATIQDEGDASALYQEAQLAVKGGELNKGLDLYRNAIVLASPELSREIEKQIAVLHQQLQEEKVEPVRIEQEEYPERSCPTCNKLISEGQEICPYCEGKPRVKEVHASRPKVLNQRLIVKWTAGGLIVAVGIILVFLGRSGKGPFLSLAAYEQVPSETVSGTQTFSENQLPSLSPAPTNTLTSSPTPTSAFGIGSTKVSPKDGMVQMYIPVGTFLMGSDDGDNNENPIHEVYLDAYWMDQKEVTNAQFAGFLNDMYNQEESGKTWLDATDVDVLIERIGEDWVPVSGYGDYPVVEVTWEGVQAYCEWADRRLPTEAEWEKAARGGLEGKRYPWGDESPVCTPGAENGAQFYDCDGSTLTVPVMSFSPNGYGLFDMTGNVWEWVNDWYGKDYYSSSPSENPNGPVEGDLRVLRGGPGFNDGYYLRNAVRYWRSPDSSDINIGFRCAADDINDEPTEDSASSVLAVGSSKINSIDDLTMIYVPAGAFLMGSEEGHKNEEPVHEVYLDAYWMNQHEVTNDQFAAFLNDQGNQKEGGGNWLDDGADNVLLAKVGKVWKAKTGHEDHPAVQVSWYGAKAYCEWSEGRLPTEAEWEKAARGGLEGKKYPWGDEPPVCVGDDNEASTSGCGGPNSVMRFSPNGYGLFDMAGHVWEWVADWYGEDYYTFSPYNNPEGPEDNITKVLRGGSWFNFGDGTRSAFRNERFPTTTEYDIGFRCVSSLSLEEAARIQLPTVTQSLSETSTPIDNPDSSLISTPEFVIGSTQTSSIDEMVQVYIPTGLFQMGSEDGDADESPVHNVYLDGYWMDKTEITFTQFTNFMEKDEYSAEPCGLGNDHPVTCVDWYDAQSYCDWAGRRLPTEAEWEKAARDGMQDTIYPWGNSEPHCEVGDGDTRRNFNWPGGGCVNTITVGHVVQKNYGLSHMAGNVWEWISDWYGPYSAVEQTNPTGPETGDYKVIRGGSWAYSSYYLRNASRSRIDINEGAGDIGFRCAESIQ